MSGPRQRRAAALVRRTPGRAHPGRGPSKPSEHPEFVARPRDTVGLHTGPRRTRSCPRRTRGQVQALGRTRPGLPMEKGRCGTMTHDRERHGATTLSAALDALDGAALVRRMRAAAARGSSASSTPRRPPRRRASRSTRSWRTTPPTSARRSGPGWRCARAGPPAPPGLLPPAERGRGPPRHPGRAPPQARRLRLVGRPPGPDRPLPRGAQHRPRAFRLDRRDRRRHRESAAREPAVPASPPSRPFSGARGARCEVPGRPGGSSSADGRARRGRRRGRRPSEPWRAGRLPRCPVPPRGRPGPAADVGDRSRGGSRGFPPGRRPRRCAIPFGHRPGRGRRLAGDRGGAPLWSRRTCGSAVTA